MARRHSSDTLVVGSRGSQLARAQTGWVIEGLRRACPGLKVALEIITTTGDRRQDQPLPEIGGKGLFTEELERALGNGEIDLAVHSAKDLPTALAGGLDILAVPPREDPRDVWVCPAGLPFADIPPDSVVGTSSLRRQAQLRRLRPDLRFIALRGNVDTRLRKVQRGDACGAVLAMAGLRRVALAGHVTEVFDPAVLLPAPGQGALALEGRAGDCRVIEALRPLHDPASATALTCERLVLAALDAGCRTPMGVLATVDQAVLHCRALLCDPAGVDVLQASASGSVDEPAKVADQVVRQLLDAGAAEIIDRCRPPQT